MSKEFELITPEGKGILGSLDDNGVVTFAIEAGETSSIPRTEMFNRMMAHFGSGVRAIRGMWVKGTNIEKVNELTAAGLPIAEAIRHAWTVTRAAKQGFIDVRLWKEPEKGSPWRIPRSKFGLNEKAMNPNKAVIETQAPDPDVIRGLRSLCASRGCRRCHIIEWIEQYEN